jgi:hypothetical protein
MEYFKDFDAKKMLFRMITLGYTAFLAGFSKSYSASPDVVHALQTGLAFLWQGVWAGFGVDQLFYHHSQTK